MYRWLGVNFPKPKPSKTRTTKSHEGLLKILTWKSFGLMNIFLNVKPCIKGMFHTCAINQFKQHCTIKRQEV
jgi:hypothetical protein